MITEIKGRLFGKTPKFWKKVQIIGVSIAAIGTFLAAAPLQLPVNISEVATYLITVGGTIAGISQLTIE